MSEAEDIYADLRDRVVACQDDDPAGVLAPDARGLGERLLSLTLSVDNIVDHNVVLLLGWLHWCRYRALPPGEGERDREDAIYYFEAVCGVVPDVVPLEVRPLLPDEVIAGTDYLWRAEVAAQLLGQMDPKHRDRGIRLLADACDDAPPGEHQLPMLLSNLGNAYSARFELRGDRRDLDAAVAAGRRAAEALTPGHSAAPGVWSNLTAVLSRRYEQTGHAADLDDAALAGRRAVEEGAGEAELFMYLTNLAAVLQRRFDRQGERADLDAAIAAIERAVDACPEDADGWAAIQNNLAVALRQRYEFFGDPADLDHAVECSHRAVDATAPDGARHHDWLTNLSSHLLVRFERQGDSRDLELAVEVGRRAVGATPPEHHQRPLMLSNLADALWTHAGWTGRPEDLDESIDLGAQAMEATPAEHTNWAAVRHNQATRLLGRATWAGGTDDLDLAIELAGQAVRACPPGNPHLAKRVSGLGGALRARFERTRDLRDIDAAIAAHQRAIDASPNGDPALRGYHSNLSRSLLDRFAFAAAPADIDAAVSAGRRAVSLIHSDNPDDGGILTNAANALRSRFLLRGDLADIDEAIEVGRRAVTVVPPGHPSLTLCLSNLGNAFQDRHERTGERHDHDSAVDAWSRAMANAAGSLEIRMTAVHSWAWSVAQVDGAAAAAPVYEKAIELLPLLAWRGIGRADQQRLLGTAGRSIATGAAACAIAAGDLPRAVELLEQGRGVLWAQLLDNRTDLSALRQAYPGLAVELDRCRAVLDGPGSSIGGSDAEARRQAARRFDALVQQVRTQPATEQLPEPQRFLRPPSFGSLAAPIDGTVIIVNVSQWRCDALILAEGTVSLIELPGLSGTEVDEAANLYLAALRAYELNPDSAGRMGMEMATTATLEWLWGNVAGPILDRLGLTGRADGEPWPRVWWCPTGPLTALPLHAAGYHVAARGDTVLDRVISSYAPTIRALAHVHGARARPSERELLVLALSQTPGAGELPGAEEEARLLRELCPPERRTVLSGAQATRGAVLAEIGRHRWFHAACHGTQNMADPGDGGLLPYDWGSAGLITVADLVSPGNTGGDLAFLAGCKTAVGGVLAADEVITVAAAMQHAGWRHVIGTAWSVWDNFAHTVAGQVYGRLLHGGVLDASRSGEALHHTVRGMRDRMPGRPSSWMPFVHLGR